MIPANNNSHRNPPSLRLPPNETNGRNLPDRALATGASTGPQSGSLTARRSAFPASSDSATFQNIPITPAPSRQSAFQDAGAGLPAPATAPNPPSRIQQGMRIASQLPRQGMEYVQQKAQDGKQFVMDGIETASQMSPRRGMEAVLNDKKGIRNAALKGAAMGATGTAVKSGISGEEVTPKNVSLGGLYGGVTGALTRAGSTFYSAALPPRPAQEDIPMQTPSRRGAPD